MSPAEAAWREEIRALVIRYNALGDRGRIDDLAQLFAPDGTLEIAGQGAFVGPAAIVAALGAVAGDNTAKGTYWHYLVATHDIEILREDRATGTAYFMVLDPGGLNHWGRYRDRYRRDPGGRWRFEHRLARRDGGAEPAGAPVGEPPPLSREGS
jgi:hypothetical protein